MGRCAAFGSDGKASFSLIQAASDSGDADASSFFSSTFLYVDGEVISSAPVTQRRERLRDLLSTIATPLQYTGSMGDLLGVLLHLLREAPSRSREASTGSSKDRARSQHWDGLDQQDDLYESAASCTDTDGNCDCGSQPWRHA